MANVRNPRVVVIPPQHLGHELHIARCVVVDMITRGYLSESLGDKVITGLSDRKFLYEGMIGEKNTFDLSAVPFYSTAHLQRPVDWEPNSFRVDVEQIRNLHYFRGYDIIDLTYLSGPAPVPNFIPSHEMAKIGYDFPKTYLNDAFIKLAMKFSFSSSDVLDKVIPREIGSYIVIHHRHKAKVDDLVKILLSIPFNIPKIIFTSEISNVAAKTKGLPFVFLTSDLKIYASSLSDTRCKLLISEWSGGGQIAQYILRSQGTIFFYYGHYSCSSNFTSYHKAFEYSARLGHLFNFWDFKYISDCKSEHFSNLELLVDRLETIF
jgi:hypothetical protein